ncbi:hypothetical protein C8R43DRAFT_944814 [Mycena crocata]|nr:hypothetical protein C8R43DRAFT_944814 [Mycena crocata]
MEYVNTVCRAVRQCSSDVPNCDPDRVWCMVIPPLSTVRNLETAFPQAWLNSTQSIIDPADTNLRLPLLSLSFYRKILEQSSWREMDGQVEWTRLITDEWLCGGNMNGIMYDINSKSLPIRLLLLQHLSLSSRSKQLQKPVGVGVVGAVRQRQNACVSLANWFESSGYTRGDEDLVVEGQIWSRCLYEQGLRGDLDDEETFMAISGKASEQVEHKKNPTHKSIHGMRYHPTFVKYCTLMCSYALHSGAQYDLSSGMTGATSQRQMKRWATISGTRMTSSELCAANLFPALAFAEWKNYLGPWICAGDGTKSMSLIRLKVMTPPHIIDGIMREGVTHVVGLTVPLGDVLSKSSEEQFEISSNIDSAKAIAIQVWVMAIQIPLPACPSY